MVVSRQENSCGDVFLFQSAFNRCYQPSSCPLLYPANKIFRQIHVPDNLYKCNENDLKEITQLQAACRYMDLCVCERERFGEKDNS